MKKNKTALISVFNKRGIAEFAKFLDDSGYEIIATKGTGKELAKSKISFTSAEKLSRNPKGFDDCIKTISFRVEAGILFDRQNSTHTNQAKKLGIQRIDMVVCNFATFEKAVKEPVDFNIKNIDVGGPLMVRAAATNHKNVFVIVDPADYKKFSRAVVGGKITDKLRRQLAARAFAYTSSYDTKLVEYLNSLKDTETLGIH
ncbi:hypothetical protein A3F62_05100 [Candidatus Woesebacteria bacterium RIFCSPHIGHO2_12_FULL_44_11]|nr:MAG: hypothetical protein A3F62_05100 [Candidatus Woesebacteria bacterium RIFCSPHIGHO2_12_FULL_44_11]